MEVIMKLLRSVILLSLSLLVLASCSSSLEQRQVVDDLYYTPSGNSNNQITEELDEDVNKAVSQYKQLDTVADMKKSTNPYEEILVDDLMEARERRNKALSSPSYGMSDYYSVTNSDAYWYASTYDPMFYNIIVMGNDVWVEPNWLSHSFTYGYNAGFYNSPYRPYNLIGHYYPNYYGYGYGNNYYGYGYGYGYNYVYGHNLYDYNYGYYGHNLYGSRLFAGNNYIYERRRSPQGFSINNTGNRESTRIRSDDNSNPENTIRSKNTGREDPRITTIRVRNSNDRSSVNERTKIRSYSGTSIARTRGSRNEQINRSRGTTVRRVINDNPSYETVKYRSRPNSKGNYRELRNSSHNGNRSYRNSNNSNYHNSNNSSVRRRSTSSSNSGSISTSGSSSSSSSSSSNNNSSGRRR
jgi:hypothetical protein